MKISSQPRSKKKKWPDTERQHQVGIPQHFHMCPVVLRNPISVKWKNFHLDESVKKYKKWNFTTFLVCEKRKGSPNFVIEII